MKGIKAMFIVFETDTEARMVEKEVVDGVVTFDNKMFYVDKNNPINITIKKGFKTVRMPLYVVKWNSPIGGEIDGEVIETEQVKPKGMHAVEANPSRIKKPTTKFREFEKDLTPEYLSKLVELKIMGNLLGKRKNTNIFLMIVMILLGAIITYFLFKSGYIK